MRVFLYPFVFLFGFLFTASLHAQNNEAPDVLLKRLTQEMILVLRQHDQQVREQPEFLYKYVDKIIVPYVDWEIMSQWVIGRSSWGSATAEQKQRFVAEFRTLLIHTYSRILKAYNNQTIEYTPIRGGIEGKERVQVNSVILSPGQEPIHVAYRLAMKAEGWKVYDISIEGVSLLKGFQSQFAEILRQNGMEALIAHVKQHNEKNTEQQT